MSVFPHDSRAVAGHPTASQNTIMKFLDPDTESAIRIFLARIPSDIEVERAILFGSRARGEARPDSDADLALIVPDRYDVWRVTWDLGGLAYSAFVDTDIWIQTVVISSSDWLYPDGFLRPGFLRTIAREGITL
jgi:predicted nucleotidyltransferase